MGRLYVQDKPRGQIKKNRRILLNLNHYSEFFLTVLFSKQGICTQSTQRINKKYFQKPNINFYRVNLGDRYTLNMFNQCSVIIFNRENSGYRYNIPT